MLRRAALCAALACAAAACSKAPPKEQDKSAPELAAPSMSAVPAVGSFKEYHDPAGRFSCEVPTAWAQDSDGATATPNVSFTLRQPSVSDPKAMDVFSLTVYFYGPGNDQFASADSYVKRNAGGGLSGGQDAVALVQLKAGPAKRWDHVVDVPGGPERLDGPKLVDSIAVVPVAKGFFALSYDSPADSHAAHMAEFERLLATFAPAR